MISWPTLYAALSTAIGKDLPACEHHAVGGGCINQSYVIEGTGTRYFVKLNHADRLDMFAAEAEGLTTLAAAGAIRVPAPLCWGLAGDAAYIALEYLPLGRGDCAERLGAQLAALHRHTATHYGWHRNNTIGATPQHNDPGNDWCAFWRERRLGIQLRQAAQNGAPASLLRKGERLSDALPTLLKDYRPAASLLHGDLWSGNYGMLTDGQPVVFDPAVYYGDRETDLAMTELFGGFDPTFYRAYQDHYPLAPGYPTRKILYNLYHVLNHFNLFGGGYAAQAERMTDQLLIASRA